MGQKNILFKVLSAASLLIAVFFVYQITYAFILPTCNPPNCTGILGGLTSGNLSIGTTAPEGLFQIASSTATDVKLVIERADMYRSAILRFNTTNAGSDWSVGLLNGGGAASNGFGISKTNLVSGAKFILTDGTFNVGIGTTNPAYKLEVAGDINIIGGGTLKVNGTAFSGSQWTTSGSNLYFSTGAVGIGLTSPDPNYKITTSSGGIKAESTSQPAGYFSSATGYALITGTGNVGIGTTNPATKLSVNGTLTIGDSTTRIIQVIPASGATENIIQNNTADADISINSAKNLNFRTWATSAWTDRMTILSGGNIGIGTTAPGSKLHLIGGGITIGSPGNLATAGGISIKQSSDVVTSGVLLESATSVNNGGMYFNNNVLTLREQGVDTLSIDSGKVGIGTTVPTAGLTIANVTAGGINFKVTGGYSEFSDSMMRHSYGVLGHLWDQGWGDTINYNYYNGTAWSTNRMTLDNSGNIVAAGTIKSTAGGFIFPDGTTQTTAGGGGSAGWTAGTGILYTTNISDAVGIGLTSPDPNYKITTSSGGIKAESTSQPAGYFSSATGYALITGTGNVGIGTASPTAKLEVNGSIGSINANPLWFLGPSNSTINSTNYHTIGYAGGANYHVTGSAIGDLTIGARPTGKIVFGTNSSATTPLSRMVIDASGNIGIGTTAPTSKLTVVGDASGATPLTVTNGASSNTFASIGQSNSNASSLNIYGNSGSLNLAAYSDGTARINNNNWTGSQLVLSTVGTVGIGQTSPDSNYKLTTTAGGIKAENSSATQPAGYFDNQSTGPDLQLGTGGVKFSDGSIQTTAGGGWSLASGNLYPTNLGGNVGIGLSDPAAPLNIYKAPTTGFVEQLRIGGTSNYASLSMGTNGAYNAWIGTYGNDLQLYAGNWRTVGAVSSENHNIVFYTSKASSADWSTPKMILNYDGNLGIGTQSPDANYKITTSVGGVKAENSSATQPAGFFNNTSTGPALVVGTGNVGIGVNNPGSALEIQPSVDNASSGLRITRPGVRGQYIALADVVGLPTILVNDDLNASSIAPSLAFSRRASDGTIYESMRINMAGNIGVGLSSPDANYKITTTAGGIKAENSNASNPAGYFKNSGTGYSLLVDSMTANKSMQIRRGAQGSDAGMISAFGTPYLRIGGAEYRTGSIQTIGFGYAAGMTENQPAEIGFHTTDVTNWTKGDIVFANRNGTSNVAPTEAMRITSAGNIGVGLTSPDTNYKITTSAGGIKAENNSATQPAGYFDNLGAGPDLQVATGGIKFSDGTLVTGASQGVKLLSSGVAILNGNTVTKDGGGAWDSQVYSKDGFAGGAYASFVVKNTSYHYMIGLNSDPTADASYGSLDYSWYIPASTAAAIYESGGNPATGIAIAVGDVLAVTYDGSNIKYLQNGVVRRTVAIAISAPLYFDSSIHSGLVSTPDATNLQFGPFGGGSSQWATSDSNISYIAGNVGIGITAPGANLEVRGSADGYIRVTGAAGSTKGGLLFGNNGADYGSLYFDNANNGVFLYQKYSTGNLNLGTNSTTNLTIESGGNVGIGTTNPSQKLEVSGGAIKATGGLIIETRTSDPGSPVAGQIWLRTDL